jgi:ATP-binding cassette subfamily B protein
VRGSARALIRSLLRRQWRRLGVALGAAVVAVLSSLVVPLLVQRAIDHGIVPGRTGPLVASGIAILGCAFISGLAAAVEIYAGTAGSRSIEAELRERLFAQLQRLHAAYHDRVATGQLMGRMNTDLQQLHQFVDTLPSTVSAWLLGIGIVAVIATMSPLLTLVAVVCFPPLAVAIVYYTRRLYPAARGMQQELGALSGLVEDTVSGIRVIKGLGAEDVQRARLRTVAGDVYDRAIDWARLRAAYLPLWALVPAVATALVLGVGGHLVVEGRLTVGALVAFNAYLAMLVWPAASMGTFVLQYQRGLAAAGRSAEVLETAPEIADHPRAQPLPGRGGEVRLEGVCFSYPRHRHAAVLDGLDLVVPAGASVALVGATGAGKSTIAQLIARLYDVDAGAVRIDGVDVRDLRLRELRATVGLVFQDPFLFADTAHANIAFADPDASPEEVERAARRAGAHDFLTTLPDGYETVLGERGYSLSGGQRQRIAIARALLADPQVLILDDATSAVDATTEAEIRHALRELMRGRTTIVIAHRPAMLALADRVALLHAGRIVAEGTHPQLSDSSPLYRAVLAEHELAKAEP